MNCHAPEISLAYRNFLYLINHKRLPVEWKDSSIPSELRHLQWRRYHCKLCEFTGRNFETQSHLFLTCNHFINLRNHVDQLIQNICGNIIPYSSFLRIHLTGLKEICGQHFRTVKILLITMNHVVWLTRNKAKHEQIITNTRDIKIHFQTKLKRNIFQDFLRLSKHKFKKLWDINNIFFSLDSEDNMVQWNYASNLRIAYSEIDRVNAR